MTRTVNHTLTGDEDTVFTRTSTVRWSSCIVSIPPVAALLSLGTLGQFSPYSAFQQQAQQGSPGNPRRTTGGQWDEIAERNRGRMLEAVREAIGNAGDPEQPAP